jgi:2'-phosphotransferase
MANPINNKLPDPISKKLQSKAKTLTWLLRHGAATTGVPWATDGYVKISDIISVGKNNNEVRPLIDLTLADYRLIEKTDKKTRVKLVKYDENGPEDVSSYKIKANQGHSYAVPDLAGIELDPAKVPYVIHGTNSAAWKLISESKYLSCMGREAMHFTEEKDFAVLGRKGCDVILRFDVKKAKDNGIIFMKAENGVVLSKGIDGKISDDFFVQLVV